MQDLLIQSIKYLVNNVDSVSQKTKQKKLATILKKFLNTIYVPEHSEKYKVFLKEFVDLHLKNKEMPGNILITQINFNKYDPEIKQIVTENYLISLPYEETENFIQILNTKLKSYKFRQQANDLIEKLIKLENYSDQEVIKLYESTIISKYLDIVDEKEETDTLILDPESIDNLLTTIQTSIEEAKTKLRVPSLYSIIDEVFTEGGFEAGRIYLFAAEPGKGKSTLMLNFLINFSLVKLPKSQLQSDKPPAILYITLENDQTETFLRLTRIITKQRVTAKNIDDSTILAVKTFFENAQNAIIVKYMPPNSNFSDLMLFIDTMSEKYRIVAIIVDYLDLLNDDLSDHKVDRRIELGRLTFYLKLLGILHKCPVLSPTQINTQGYGDPNKLIVPSKRNLDESRQKAQNADFVGLMFDVPKALLPVELQYEYDMDEHTVFGINVDKNRDNTMGIMFGVRHGPTYSIKLFDINTTHMLYNHLFE